MMVFTPVCHEYTDNERVVIVGVSVLMNNRQVNTHPITASAVCHPDDTFDYQLGRELAFARARKRALSQLGEAVGKGYTAARRHEREVFRVVHERERQKSDASLSKTASAQ